VVLVESLGPRFFAPVAIVLLVDAVELEQLLGVVAEGGRLFDELLLDESSQVVARRLDGLVSGQAVERCSVRQVRQ